MPPRIRFLYSIMMVTLFLVASAPLFREFSRRSDIWWTPRTMLVALTESADRVEIYARGRPLLTLLEAGQIQLAEDARTSVLTPREVGLRFNHWDRVRAERLPLLLVSVAACAVTALMFLLVVTGRLAYRGEKGELAA
jgi:hypothetical protein